MLYEKVPEITYRDYRTITEGLHDYAENYIKRKYVNVLKNAGVENYKSIARLLIDDTKDKHLSADGFSTPFYYSSVGRYEFGLNIDENLNIVENSRKTVIVEGNWKEFWSGLVRTFNSLFDQLRKEKELAVKKVFANTYRGVGVQPKVVVRMGFNKANRNRFNDLIGYFWKRSGATHLADAGFEYTILEKALPSASGERYPLILSYSPSSDGFYITEGPRDLRRPTVALPLEALLTKYIIPFYKGQLMAESAYKSKFINERMIELAGIQLED